MARQPYPQLAVRQLQSERQNQPCAIPGLAFRGDRLARGTLSPKRLGGPAVAVLRPAYKMRTAVTTGILHQRIPVLRSLCSGDDQLRNTFDTNSGQCCGPRDPVWRCLLHRLVETD